MNTAQTGQESWAESSWDASSRNQQLALGAILATAAVAGVVAFMLRRPREPERPTPAMFAERARALVREDAVPASREFLIGKVLPELKPALLAVLDEIEESVERAFRRLERTIKKL